MRRNADTCRRADCESTSYARLTLSPPPRNRTISAPVFRSASTFKSDLRPAVRKLRMRALFSYSLSLLLVSSEWNGLWDADRWNEKGISGKCEFGCGPRRIYANSEVSCFRRSWYGLKKKGLKNEGTSAVTVILNRSALGASVFIHYYLYGKGHCWIFKYFLNSLFLMCNNFWESNNALYNSPCIKMM